MAGNLDFSRLLDFWNSMTLEQRQALTKNLQELTSLSGSLKGRGLIATGVDTGRVLIVKRHPDVTRLKKLVKLCNVQNVTFEYVKKTKST